MLTLEWLSAISWQTVDITLWQTVERQRRFMDAAERRTEVTTVCVCKQSGETGDTVWQNWTGQFNTAYLPSWWLLQYASLPHLHTTTDWSRFSVKPLMGTLQLHSNGQLYSSTVIGTMAAELMGTTHPSTASVPTSYYLMWHYIYLCTQKGSLTNSMCDATHCN